MSKSRNYCFTLNNYTKEEVAAIKESCELNKYVFLCFGHEVGSEDTEHLQGYIELKNPRSMRGLHKDPGFARAHFEVRKGTKLEAVTYCAKEFGYGCYCRYLESKAEDKESFVSPEHDETKVLKFMRKHPNEWRCYIKEYGQLQYFEAGSWDHGLTPGKRSDINVVKELVKSGASMNTILDHANSYQAARMGQLALQFARPTRMFKSTVIWLHGPTGVGKTRKAWEECCDPKDVWTSPCGNLQWFDGYDRHKVAILDDFRKFFHGFHEFLKLIDRYPYKVPIKGGFVDWCPKEIWITSFYSPHEAFASDSVDEDIQQVLRRIDKIEHITTSIYKLEHGTEV